MTEARNEYGVVGLGRMDGNLARQARPGTPVSFELVENERGLTARNVRRERPNQERSS